MTDTQSTLSTQLADAQEGGRVGCGSSLTVERLLNTEPAAGLGRRAQPTVQGFIGLDHLRHEHGSLAGDVGEGAQRRGEVDGGDGGVHHELKQLLQGCLAFFP